MALRLAKGVFWSTAGTVISRGLMLIATVLVARMLGRTAYGEFGMIQSTLFGMFGVFAGFGLGLTATKHVAEYCKSDPERAGRIIGLSGLFAAATGGSMAVALLIFAPWLAEHTLNAPHLTGALRIGAVILFAHAINGAQTGALSGFEAFKSIARVNLFVGLIAFPILICGARFGGLTGAIWALALNLGVNWLLNHVALRREMRRFGVPFTFRQCSREWPVLWRFSLPAVLSAALVGPIDWSCAAMLVHRPNGYSEMGVYSATNQWQIAMLFLPWVLGGVMLPVLSEQFGKNDKKQSAGTLIFAIKINMLFVLPLVLVTSLVSPQIMNLYGEGFRDGWPTLVVVSLTAGLIAVHTPVSQFLAASGNMWPWLVMNVGWALTFVIGTLLLLDHGSLGLATSRAVAHVLQTAWALGFVVWMIRKGARK
jgi:O-antigen/teichoic acid export membrane protein